MTVAASKEEFDKAIEGIPFHEVDLEAEVVCVEPITGAYFRDSSRQRCMIRRKNGNLYWSHYD